ncbi:MAG: LacI family DNA-binding transcriptional regulator [Chloroflexota bacterium]
MDARPGRKHPTLADVARESGVSPAAASLAIRGEPGVSTATREHVIETARRMGYRSSARTAPRPARPVTVGLLIKAPPGDAPEVNRFYAPVMTGVEELCRLRGLDLRLAALPVDADYHPLEVPRLVSDRSCDGLIVLGAQLSSGTAALLADGPPVVLVDAYADDRELDSVVSDNVGGARAAVEHLIGRGHRAIALAGTRTDSFPSIRGRRRGYLEAMEAAGLAPRLIDATHSDPDAAAAAVLADLAAHPGTTAVFCSNDEVACATIQAAARAGIDVPGRLSVVGFDDIDLARYVAPQLTTLAVDKVGMGRLAVVLLLHRLEFPDAAPAQAQLMPRLVERDSVIGPAKRR